MIIILKGIFYEDRLGLYCWWQEKPSKHPHGQSAGNNDKIDILEIDIHFLGIFDKQIIASQIE